MNTLSDVSLLVWVLCMVSMGIVRRDRHRSAGWAIAAVAACVVAEDQVRARDWVFVAMWSGIAALSAFMAAFTYARGRRAGAR